MKRLLLLLSIVNISALVNAQDTFSIVAVDKITGEVGSAGASCLAANVIAPKGAVVISDVHPGRGAIHSQAQYVAANQTYARGLMDAGLSPQQILDSLLVHDVNNTPQIRQYGIADFDPSGNPRAAGFTGTGCLDYKNHVVGPYYSIQGNILLGQAILDSMEACFLRAKGPLADRLMAALHGAEVPGADTRCAPKGISSLSSFIRVAKPGDSPAKLYLDLVVSNTKQTGGKWVEPIDSLQRLYNVWKMTTSNYVACGPEYNINIYPNPADEFINVYSGSDEGQHVKINISDISGRTLYSQNIKGKVMYAIPTKQFNTQEWILVTVESQGKVMLMKKVMLRK